MLRTFNTLIITLIVLNINAQVFSPMQLISESPDDPLIVVSADLNNDGYDDVVYSSIGDNEISCNLFNPETGSFDNFVLLGTEFPYCTSLFPADLDNDGLIDILAVSQTSDKVGWYKNTGNGIFVLQPFINQDATHAASVTAADTDMDGDMDVISAQKGDDNVLLYINDGNGNFSAPVVITASAQIPVVVVSADLNNDTYPDIIAGYGQTDKIVCFINNGDGTFQPESTVTNQADLITNIITADLNGDGNTDIISTSKNDNKVAWYKNIDGNGNFSDQIIISQTITNAFGLASADFDLDGDMDIVTASPNDDRIYLFKNSNMSFQSCLISAEVIEPKGLAAGDFNNDGLIDIAALDSWEAAYNNKVYWFINGKSCFIVHNINQNKSSWHLAMNDYNLDGNIDIFYSDGQYVCRVDNLNSGEFSDEIILYDNGYNIYDLGFMDANDDGFDDLFVLDAMGDSFFWFKNINGSFGSPIFIDTQGNGPVSLDFSDIDGDSNIDILVALANENKIVLYLNSQGNGTFTKTIITDTVSSVNSVCFSDYDNDGDDDIFYSDNNGILYLSNDGTGSFTTGGVAAYFGTYSTTVTKADINNDGYFDIVCNPDYTHWIENNQDGTFTDHETETWGGSYDVAPGDLNNDGNTDIISAAGMINRAYFLKNISAGDNFEVNTYAVDNDIRAVSLGDINNDGYEDITLGSWPAENLSWAENYSFRIIRQPADIESCENGDAFFSVLTAGVTDFQWQINNGSVWNNIENNSVFEGSNKALLNIYNISEDMFENQFRCVITDEQYNTYFTQAATLFKSQPTVSCLENQLRTADNTNTYTVVGNEFDPDTIFNPCNEPLTVVNNYNNQETLAGSIFQTGNYTITWMIKNMQNEVIDSCYFNIEIEAFTQINEDNKKLISIYPNPFTDFITINSSSEKTDLQLKITDISGRIVLFQKLHSRVETIDLSKLEKGVYLVSVLSKRLVYVKKIVTYRN